MGQLDIFTQMSDMALRPLFTSFAESHKENENYLVEI